MRLRDFIYVAEIAKYKSFSKASNSLFISQPALSKAIKRLEEELGVQIFIRDNVSVSLTSVGEVFLEDAHKILRITNQITKKMSDLSETKKRTLRVGSSQFYIKYYLPYLMPEFNRLFPNINVEIVEGVSTINEKKLLGHEIDIAIVPLPITMPKIIYETIYEETLQFAFCKTNSKNLNLYNNALKDGYFDLSKFRDSPFILLKNGFKMRYLAASICEEFGFSPNVILETENSDTINSLISNNYGVSFLPSFITKYDNVKYIDFKSINSKRKIVAAYDISNSNDKTIQSFVKCLREVLSNQPFQELIGETL